MTEAKAILISRIFFDLQESVLASVLRVKNLRNRNQDYFLVIFGEKNATVAVAAVGCEKGEIKVSARLSGNLPHLNISKEKALELCKANENVPIEMVWAPGALSRSPLYPIWKVNLTSGVKYVNQEGEISDQLDNGMAG
jgi:hypothetical protein